MIELAVGTLIMTSYILVYLIGFRRGIHKAVDMLTETLTEIEHRLSMTDDTS